MYTVHSQSPWSYNHDCLVWFGLMLLTLELSNFFYSMDELQGLWIPHFGLGGLKESSFEAKFSLPGLNPILYQVLAG